MRAENDAILIGIETALADDPMLDCRIPGLERYSPTRVVLDSRLRLDPSLKLVRTAAALPTIVFTAAPGDGALERHGVLVVTVAADAQGRPDLGAVLTALAARNVTRLLVEGGATVHRAFLADGFADALEIFTAPITLGEKGHGAIAALKGDIAGKFTRTSRRKIGTDVLESYSRRA